MIKKVIVLDGKVINVGEWDYQSVEIDGEQVAMNPMPEDAIEEEREMEYNEERGWYEVSTLIVPTDKDRIAMLEETIMYMLLGGGLE